MRLLFFLLFCSTFCQAQQILTADEFITNGLSNYEELKSTAGENLRFPWIENYEFRTETRDFDFEQQQYTLRVSPSTSKIRKAQKAYADELRNAPDVDGQEIYCDLKLQLHLDWLNLYILNEQKSYISDLLIILNDKKTIYERIIGTYDFDPSKVMKLQTDRSDMEATLNKIQLEEEYLLGIYNIQDRELDFSDFISPESILDFLNNDSNLSTEEFPVDMQSAYETALILKEMELESSEEKKWVDFVQLRYRGPHSDAFQERLALGIGFQLSNSGNAKLKMQELQLELEEIETEVERDKQDRQGKIDLSSTQLKFDLKEYFLFQNIISAEREELQKLSEAVSKRQDASPFFFLDIEERNLVMKIKSLNKKEDILRDYLFFVKDLDQMCQSNTSNYLTQK